MSDEMLVLDRIENIEVSHDVHHNNLNVLRSHDIGMFHLAKFTRQREIEALKRHGRDKIVFIGELTEETLLLGCVFDWFAISLVNYMRTIKLMEMLEEKGWVLADLQKKAVQHQLRKVCRSYIEKIAPDVFQWRNKIAAHRIATDPRSDNLSMLTYSTFTTVTYHSPHYEVGGLKVSLGDGSVSDLQSWSLTEKYGELGPRYWPDRELISLDW